MGIKEVVKHPAPILLTSALSIQIVEDDPTLVVEISALIQDMIDTMNSVGGVGIAAPQIGVAQCVIVYKTRFSIVGLVNPEIVASSGHARSFGEGCLSCPDEFFDLRRKKDIVVEGYTIRDGKLMYFREKVTDRTTSFRMQHEIDHLHGITIKERAKK